MNIFFIIQFYKLQSEMIGEPLIFSELSEETVKELSCCQKIHSVRLTFREKLEEEGSKKRSIYEGTNYKNRQIVLEIRKTYVLQVLEKGKDILSGFQCDYDHKFQVLRATANDSNSVGRQFGISFYLRGKESQPIHLYKSKEEEGENSFAKFCQVLQRQYIVQYGFHKIYKAIRKIGKGATACVYSSLRLTDEKQVAIKSFKKETYFSIDNGNGKIGFQKQFKMLTKFNSRYICPLLGVYQSENSVYMVMELLSRNLLSYIQKFNFPEPKLCKQIMLKLAFGIQSMHQKKIMHRDLKLENIMIRGDGKTEIEPVIADFGLAEYVGETKAVFVRCGTPGYVAPQVINTPAGQKNILYNQSCDIFSLGVIYHILLLGKTVFEGSEIKEVIRKNKECNVDYDFGGNANLTEQARDLLRRMLEKDPSKRIPIEEVIKHTFFLETNGQLLSQKSLKELPTLG